MVYHRIWSTIGSGLPSDLVYHWMWSTIGSGLPSDLVYLINDQHVVDAIAGAQRHLQDDVPVCAASAEVAVDLVGTAWTLPDK